MERQQNFSEREEIEALRLQNSTLKKDLDREKQLHSLLFKEWQELKEKFKGREEEVYEGPGNERPFYRYAFYTLLVASVIAFCFLLFRSDTDGTDTPAQALADSPTSSSPAPNPPSLIKTDSLLKNDSQPAGNQQQAQPEKPVVVQQPPVVPEEKKIVEQPATVPEEKKVVSRETPKPAATTLSKPAAEQPLTDELRETISSDGFDGYFQHRRNPFKRSSERYKIWQDGYNDGKAGAQAVEAKDPSSK